MIRNTQIGANSIEKMKTIEKILPFLLFAIYLNEYLRAIKICLVKKAIDFKNCAQSGYYKDAFETRIRLVLRFFSIEYSSAILINQKPMN